MRILSLILVFAAATIFSTSCTENINAPVVEDEEFSVDENSLPGTIVGVLIAYDLDEGQTVSFKIVDGNDEGTFEIDPLGGHLSIADPEMLNYELNTQLLLSVLVTDDHPKDPMESVAKLTILINDLNEFAPVMDDQIFEIDENPAKGDLIGIIEASDPELHQNLSFSIISGNEDQIFSLDSETVSLSVNDPAAFDFDINQQHLLSLQVRDIHLDSKSDTALITVKINPL